MVSDRGDSCLLFFLSISIILRVIPIEIPKKYKIEAPLVRLVYFHANRLLTWLNKQETEIS